MTKCDLLLLNLFMFVPMTVLAEDSSSNSVDIQLLTKSLDQFENLRDFYSNYSCDGEIAYERVTLPDTTLAKTGVTHGAFAMRGDEMYRISGFWRGAESLLIVNPQRFHLFEKSKSSGELFVRAHGSSYQPSGVPEEWLFRAGGYDPGHVLIVLKKLESKSNPKLLSTTVSRIDGEEITSVESLSRSVEHHLATYYSDRHWALKDHTVWIPNNKEKTYWFSRKHCEYQGQVNGFPIIRQLVREIGYAPFGSADVDHQQVYDPGEVVVTQRRTLTVEHFTPGPPELSVFDPAPILKEIGGLKKPSKPWWQVVFLALNAIFLVWLGLFFWRRSRQHEQQPPVPNPPRPAPP